MYLDLSVCQIVLDRISCQITLCRRTTTVPAATVREDPFSTVAAGQLLVTHFITADLVPTTPQISTGEAPKDRPFWVNPMSSEGRCSHLCSDPQWNDGTDYSNCSLMMLHPYSRTCGPDRVGYSGGALSGGGDSFEEPRTTSRESETCLGATLPLLDCL